MNQVYTKWNSKGAWNQPIQKEWDELPSLNSINTVFEPKRDGVRLMVDVDQSNDREIHGYTKSCRYTISSDSKPFVEQFPELKSDLENFLPKQTTVVLDG